MRKLLRTFILLSSLCLFGALKSQIQFSGKLLSLQDSTGLAFANITINKTKQQIITDEAGNFTIPNLTDEITKIDVYKIGFIPTSFSIYLDNIKISQTFFLPVDITQLNEVVVYGNQSSLKLETANNIEILETKSMREQGAMNLSDGIAKLPGVTQLSTGAGISKPVIRGLFGNRIQTVLLGMRFDNQQWQDEHGLGLSDIGVSKIEIIKGPSSLFYGSEAMGGVLNIINEKPAPIGKLQTEFSSRYFSNTSGYSIDAAVKKSESNYYYAIHLGSESHADYSDGNNKRILNSRFGGTIAKGTLGFKFKKLTSENNYLFGFNQFGFLMDAYQLYDKADERWSRNFERPHHAVMMNMFTSQNNIQLKTSQLKINFGAHLNNRQEQEGAGGISLDMLLKTYVLALMWEKKLNNATELTIGSQNQYQNNINSGSRIIVPDANLSEASTFIYLKNKHKYVVSEGGLRYDLKTIQTLPTAALNTGNSTTPGNNIIPANKLYNTLNGSIGVSLFDLKNWNLKFNFSSGYRGPNLAELSSNGLHEGSLRYEIGNINLKIEQNFCSDVFVEFHNKNFTFFADAYANRFLNYIYLQPSKDKEYIGFKIYNYIQKNALISGLESGIKIHPYFMQFLLLSSTYCNIVGQTDAHEYLPFIPAQKLNNEVKFKFQKNQFLQNSFIAFNFVYVFAQTMNNQFETKTNAYHLLNLSLGKDWQLKKNKIQFSISANNLSNESYYDHLSRFKYFGINNIGRSININLKYQFN